MSSGIRDVRRLVAEPLAQVPLQRDLDLHQPEQRARHAVLAQDLEQRARDHVARERPLAGGDERRELVEALEQEAALDGREAHARDLEQDRLDERHRRLRLDPVVALARLLPGHLHERRHQPEEGRLHLARGLGPERRHERLEEDHEALGGLGRLAARAAPARLDERAAALAEHAGRQLEERGLVERRAARDERGQERSESLEVAACGVARGDPGHLEPGVTDQPFELREERRVERILAGRIRNRVPPFPGSVCARRREGQRRP